jgi:hypothetical protein
MSQQSSDVESSRRQSDHRIVVGQRGSERTARRGPTPAPRAAPPLASLERTAAGLAEPSNDTTRATSLTAYPAARPALFTRGLRDLSTSRENYRPRCRRAGFAGCCYCFAQQPPARRPLASLPHFAGRRPERRGAHRPLRLSRRRTAARPAAASLSPNFASSRLCQFSIANRRQSCTIAR